jgi:hypothetical protein
MYKQSILRIEDLPSLKNKISCHIPLIGDVFGPTLVIAMGDRTLSPVLS